jgi:hypothetical protein
MKARWKLLGLAGAAGVAATGAVVARKTRIQSDYEPDEIRDRLRDRLAGGSGEDGGAAPPPPGDAAPAAE